MNNSNQSSTDDRIRNLEEEKSRITMKDCDWNSGIYNQSKDMVQKQIDDIKESEKNCSSSKPTCKP